MTTKTDKAVEKSIGTLRERSRRALWPTLALSAVAAHLLTLKYIQGSFKDLLDRGATTLSLDTINRMLSGLGAFGVFLSIWLALFLLFMVVYILEVQISQFGKYKLEENKDEK